jgi:hypothetical protein
LGAAEAAICAAIEKAARPAPSNRPGSACVSTITAETLIGFNFFLAKIRLKVGRPLVGIFLCWGKRVLYRFPDAGRQILPSTDRA